MSTEPIFANLKNEYKDKEGEILTIRAQVSAKVWRAFKTIIYLNDLVLKDELAEALRRRIVSVDLVNYHCSLCDKKIDKDNYVICSKNGKYKYYCLNCVKVE